VARSAPKSGPAPWVKQKGRPASVSSAEIRECRRHGLIEFHRYSAGRGAYRWRCKRCVGECVTRRHQKLKRILVEEAGGRCAVCGYSRCIINLHFHHVDPTTKAFSMSMARGKSIASYRAEAEKCVLVCANCHGENRGWPRRVASGPGSVRRQAPT
jgi:hypothetical protein